jgi:signal transduction histidine kinase
MNTFLLSNLLVSFTSLVLILLLLFYGRRKIHRVWAICNVAILVWGIGTVLITAMKNLNLIVVGWKIALVGGYFIAVLYYHTVYIFTKSKNKKFLVFSYLFIILAAMSTLLFSNVVIPNFKLVFGFIYFPIATVSYSTIYLGWGLIVSVASLKLFNFMKSARGTERIQAKYILLAFAIGFVGGGSTLWPSWGIPFYPIGNFGVALYAIIGTYAILKYRLLDIKVAITRTGIFVAVYTLVLGVPFAVATWLKTWLMGIFGSQWWMVPLVLLAILATAGPFIYIYIERKAEERLLREQRRYQQTLKQASVGMTRIRDLNRLLNLIAHIVTKTVHISYAAIYLYNREDDEYILQVSRDKGRIPISKIASDNSLIRWITSQRQPLIYEEVKRKLEDSHEPAYSQLEENMRSLNAAVVIPSFLENKSMGFLVLGDKISGQIYTPDDLDVFQVLASQAALAIENAQFYDETKKMQEQVAQAEKMATIGTMADGLSHQINNRFHALSLIAGDTIDSIKMTDTSKCTPEVKQMLSQISYALDRIQTNVLQGGEVVKGIMKYTRKGEEGFEALTLDRIIDSTLDMVQFKVKLSEIDIIRNYPKDTPKIYGNVVQLQEVFFNFIDNAYDATVERRNLLQEPNYRGKITVSAQPKNNHLEIIVEDNGIGVKDEDYKKVFTPFFTTKNSARKGTGLGLYVIRKIITDTHKGKISFESKYKTGTRFILELQMAK